jgi:hypothetical protein
MKTESIISRLKIIIAVFALASVFYSCKKDTVVQKDSDTSDAIDQSIASSASNDLINISDEASQSFSLTSFKTTNSNLISSSCASVSFDTISSAKTLTVNFGSVFCLCNDGKTRKGALVISYTGRYKDSLTEITINPQNYFVDYHQVTGTKTIKNKGHNAQHHLIYKVDADLQIIKANNGGIISWQSSREREFIAGESTLNWADDIYSITGTASGIASNGTSYTSVITSGLIKNMSIGCSKNFTQGKLEHTPSGKATRYIDFGNGACDNQITVAINGNIYTVDLR